MASKLKKQGPYAPDAYILTGGTDGLAGPGRRTVRTLRIAGMTAADSASGLVGLESFPDLRELYLERVDGVDLTALGALELELLSISGSAGIALAQLPRAGAPLERLELRNLSEPVVPDRLELPRALTWLSLNCEGEGFGGEWVSGVVGAVDWTALPALEELRMKVISPPLPELDLAFVDALPALMRLEAFGILPAGPLPTRDGLEVSGFEEPALRLYAEMNGMPAPAVTSPFAAAQEPDGSWGVYGSFAELLGQEREQAAVERLTDALCAHDPELLRRLEFDSEADGTGVYGPSEADVLALMEFARAL